MAVVHMRRNPDRGNEFPTECGAVCKPDFIADSWDDVTCNNCIRKFGPKNMKDTYKSIASDKGVKVLVSYTPEEKQEDSARIGLEGLLNGIRSQQLRLEGTKISVQAMLTPLADVDQEAIVEILHCTEYLEAALNNLRMVKSMVFTAVHGGSVNGEEGGSV